MILKREVGLVMNQKKILPVTYPPITSNFGMALPLSILYCYEDTYDWIYSHYINTVVFDNPDSWRERGALRISFFVDTDTRRFSNDKNLYSILLRSQFPFLQQTEVSHEMLEVLELPILTFIKSAIDTGRYLYVRVNVAPIKLYHCSDYFLHGLFIYGYDDEQQVLHFADFVFNHGKFTFATCPYQEFTEGYYSTNVTQLETGDNTIGMMKYWNRRDAYDWTTYELDMEYILESIHDYLQPDPKVARRFDRYLRSTYALPMKTYTGVDVYRYFQLSAQRSLDYGALWREDLTLYHCLLDHKEMMLKRFDYLYENGYLAEEKAKYFEAYQTVRDHAVSLQNMFLKAFLAKNPAALRKSPALLEETKELETELLAKIFLE